MKLMYWNKSAIFRARIRRFVSNGFHVIRIFVLILLWIQELTAITRNWRWTVISHTENNYSKKNNAFEMNGKQGAWNWLTVGDVVCRFYASFILSPVHLPAEYFHNNYCMANNRWGILWSALHRIAYQLYPTFYSIHFSFVFFFQSLKKLPLRAYKRLSCLKLFFSSWQETGRVYVIHVRHFEMQHIMKITSDDEEKTDALQRTKNLT